MISGRLAVCLLALALSGCAGMTSPGGTGEASSSLRRYVFADPESGCQARRLRAAAPVESMRWTGGCVGGFASGEGTMNWSRAGEAIETDQGDFRDGLLEGDGSRLLADGSRYEGRWRAGRREGRGTQSWVDGSTYTGHWREDEIDGQGTMRSVNGQRYDGDWRDGKRDGQGVQSWPSGTRYEGAWSADLRDGRGKFTWPDGSYFEGKWDDGKPQSKGSLFVDSDGSRYLNWEYPQ